MKKIIFLFTILVLSINNSWAYDFTVDEIYYNISSATDKTVSVTSDYTASTYSGAVVIPSTVTYNGTEYSVNDIGYSAFSGDANLQSVDIPSSVKTISGYAFDWCSGLTTVSIASSGLTIISEHAFSSCSKLSSFTIPSTVTTIKDYAFSACSNLPEINIPSSVSLIGSYTFNGCTKFTSISIPALVANIGSYAFSGCTALNSVSLSEGLISIGDRAFSGCTHLTTITIPPSFDTMGNYAFANCSGLQSVIMPSTSIRIIGSNAFENCIKLSSFTGSVINTGDHVFANCSELSSVDLQQSEGMGDEMFVGCSKLTSIVIPSTFNFLSQALSNCTAIESVTISEGVTEIYPSAFLGCTNLASVTIPASMETILTSAFSGCTNLLSIYSYAPVPVDLSSYSSREVFYKVDKTNCILHVPAGSKELYAKAVQWKDFLNIVDDITTGVFNAKASNLKITTGNGKAVISGLPQGAYLAVYNLQGIAIYSQKADNDIVTVSLPAHGMYVVKVGVQSFKVVY